MRVPHEFRELLSLHTARTGQTPKAALKSFLDAGNKAFGLGLKFDAHDAVDSHDPSTLDLFPGTPRVRSVSAFLRLVYSLHRGPSKDADPLRFYYRGQPGPYPLLPKLLRPHVAANLITAHRKAFGRKSVNIHDVQREIIFRLSRYAEQYRTAATVIDEMNDFLSWLCIAQHHSLPTFLLDWAVNPLASLYFSCADVKAPDHYLDGVVWVMKLKPFDDRSPSSILHMEKLPFHLKTSDPDIASMHKICKYSAISRDEPKLIVPRMLTRRIEVQAGRFLASSNVIRVNRIRTTPKNIAWESIEPLAVIPRRSKGRVLAELDVLRIHHGSTYADLDSYAAYLSEGHL